MRATVSWSFQWGLLLVLAHWISESESLAPGFLVERRRGANHRRRVDFATPFVRTTRGLRVVVPLMGGDGEVEVPDQQVVNGEGSSSSSPTWTTMMDELAHQLTSDDLTAPPLSDGSNADLVQPLAPPLSYDKFLKMQDKRVVVTIRYSGESGLRPYFLTVAKKLKASHPDVVIERRILPSVEKDGNNNAEGAVFEILVDGKVVIGKKNRTRRQRVTMDLTKSRSVFVSMQEMDVAISRARRRRRPTTAYGGGTD